jgi:hypothetical protein
MRQGTILVVTAMDKRTVVLRARAGRYRLGAWSDGHQRHPTVGVGQPAHCCAHLGQTRANDGPA